VYTLELVGKHDTSALTGKVVKVCDTAEETSLEAARNEVRIL
jgi:hypothetical protein